MAINFTFVGSIRPCKDSEKFKSHEVRAFDSGWVQNTLKFNAINGTNSHLMQIRAGYYGDKNGGVDSAKTKIYYPVKTEGKGKFEYKNVGYDERDDEEVLKTVRGDRKYVLDLSSPSNPTNKREFIFEKDFLDNVNKRIINNPDVKNVKFKILGDVEVAYSESKGVFYRTFVPKRISLAEADEKECMTMNLLVIYNKESLVDGETKNRYMLNGYVGYYDNQYRKDSCKGNAFMPVDIVFDDLDDKKNELVVKRFREFPLESSEYRRIGLLVDVIDGVESVKVTEDMLGDEARENIEYGFSTLEEELKKAGSTTFGSRVSELRFNNWRRDSEDTAYEDEDLLPPSHDEKEEDTDDIFADDDI